MWAAGALRGSPGVDHRDAAPGAGQDQGGGQAGGAAADDHHVVLVHGLRVSRLRSAATTFVAVSGNRAVQWAA